MSLMTATNGGEAVINLFDQPNNLSYLGTEEQHCGDTARRLGNEYLAQMLITANIEAFNNYGVKKIVTTVRTVTRPRTNIHSLRVDNSRSTIQS